MQKCARNILQHTFATQKHQFQQKNSSSETNGVKLVEKIVLFWNNTHREMIFFEKKCVCKMRHLKKMPQETKLIIEMKYLFVSGIKAQILHRIIHSII